MLVVECGRETSLTRDMMHEDKYLPKIDLLISKIQKSGVLYLLYDFAFMWFYVPHLHWKVAFRALRKYHPLSYPL